MSYGTAYDRLKADRALFEMAVRALAEGNALRATARIVQGDKDTVCAWLDRVARHCRTVMLSLWHNVHVRESQLDELWSFVHECDKGPTLVVLTFDPHECSWYPAVGSQDVAAKPSRPHLVQQPPAGGGYMRAADGASFCTDGDGVIVQVRQYANNTLGCYRECSGERAPRWTPARP